MPSAWIIARILTCFAESPAPPEATAAAPVSAFAISVLPLSVPAQFATPAARAMMFS